MYYTLTECSANLAIINWTINISYTFYCPPPLPPPTTTLVLIIILLTLYLICIMLIMLLHNLTLSDWYHFYFMYEQNKEEELIDIINFTKTVLGKTSIKKTAYFMTFGKLAFWPSYPSLVETEKIMTIWYTSLTYPPHRIWDKF